MMTGYEGTFVISWSQTEVDGLQLAPLDVLAVGATWSWTGEKIRVDGPGSVLVLGASASVTDLRARAAKSVRRLVGQALNDTGADGRATALPDPDDPLLDRGFAVTDGRRRYTISLVDVPDRRPLLVFFGDAPPPDTDLWITHVFASPAHLNRIADLPRSVICFTPGTRIATPVGPVPVEELQEGDPVLTKDDGPQPIRWLGRRRMSGARLFAMPELRPIRIRAGATGLDVPDQDLVVSPDHRMVLKGSQARALFGTGEVLVRARDILNDHSVTIDHRAREVTYIHMMFERHQIVWANGLESESFHPASMPLDAIEEHQRAALIARIPEIERDTALYGGFARRMLSRSEAAILQADRPPGH